MTAQISIVVTVYNRAIFLAEAISSILSQTYTHFELLIWDDGSTDNSLEIAQQYASQDSRIQVIAAPHLGRGQALKRAVSKTQGEYLCWVDSDDRLASTALEETVSLLENQPKLGMVYTNYQVIDSDGKSKGIGSRCQMPYSKERLLIDFMTFHFRLIRRSLYDQVGGINPKFSAAQDYDLCLRLSEVAHIHHLHKSLYFYRDHADNISNGSTKVQIAFSEKAINLALVRRGMHTHYELIVLEEKNRVRFKLQRKRRTTPKVFGIGLGRTGTTSARFNHGISQPWD